MAESIHVRRSKVDGKYRAWVSLDPRYIKSDPPLHSEVKEAFQHPVQVCVAVASKPADAITQAHKVLTDAGFVRNGD